MDILYVSALCSRSCFRGIYEKANGKVQQQAQKYHILMAEGISQGDVRGVTVLSARPINRRISRKWVWGFKREIEDDLTFWYLPFINLPVLRQWAIFITSFACTLVWCIQHRTRTIVCDVLNMSICYGALLAAKITKTHIAGIVTDVPGFYAEDENVLSTTGRFNRRLNTVLISSLDSYILLTKAMNEAVNPKSKPYRVIEGQVDINMSTVDNNLEAKYPSKICMFAGSLNKENGIDILIDAFIKADVVDSELHIYGTGDFEENIKLIVEKHPNIHFYGSVINDYVVMEQVKATLLVNPRPTNREFVSYSFPSKNMEYMVSGTPMMTTKLPGMPQEYYEYVYLIENETIDGLCEDLKTVLSQSKEDMHQKGRNAKAFVLREKNNVVQAGKIIDMFREICE